MLHAVAEGQNYYQDDTKTVSQFISEFEELLVKYPDVPQSLVVYRSFIKEFLKAKTLENPLPFVEIMTILKANKPNIHFLIKKQSRNNLIMNLLTNIEMDLQEATQRIYYLKSKTKASV